MTRPFIPSFSPQKEKKKSLSDPCFFCCVLSSLCSFYFYPNPSHAWAISCVLLFHCSASFQSVGFLLCSFSLPNTEKGKERNKKWNLFSRLSLLCPSSGFLDIALAIIRGNTWKQTRCCFLLPFLLLYQGCFFNTNIWSPTFECFDVWSQLRRSPDVVTDDKPTFGHRWQQKRAE